MQRRVNRLAAVGLEILNHQVEQPVLGLKSRAVEDELQARVEISVMAQAFLDEIGMEFYFFEDLRVRLEFDYGSVRFTCRFSIFVALDFALLEPCFDVFALPMTADHELF